MPSCKAETDFVPYMALYVRYSLSCSSDFCTLYVPPMFLLLLKMFVEVTKIQKKLPQKAKRSQKSHIVPKKPHMHCIVPKNPKISKISKNGLLCSLCGLHGLLGILGLCHSVF
jgi:hypothetical protein